MERFVQFVAAGGVVLVAALWATTLAVPGTVAWLLAATVAAGGGASVLVGIWLELDVDT